MYSTRYQLPKHGTHNIFRNLERCCSFCCYIISAKPPFLTEEQFGTEGTTSKEIKSDAKGERRNRAFCALS